MLEYLDFREACMKKDVIVKVKCDGCGTEIECPEEMLKTSKKHLCYSCFQDPKKYEHFSEDERRNVHVDAPLEQFADTVADNIAAMMVEREFPGIWSEKKEELKELSKKDLAKEMFGIGVFIGAQACMDFMNVMGGTTKEHISATPMPKKMNLK